MLLAVDIGNSNIKVGIFEGKHLVSKFSVSTNGDLSADALTTLIGSGVPVTQAIICSVVPEKVPLLTDALLHRFGVKAFVVSNDLDLGLRINYEPRSDLGNDRLVNGFAATEKYGAPCIVVSIGTATTFDLVDKDRQLIGGVIAPGMRAMARALHLSTAKLPEIEIEKPGKLLGNTTVESIRSGIYYGHLAMIEGMAMRLKTVADADVKIIATGGFAPLMAKHTTVIDILDENLLLDGLRLIQDRIHPE